MSLDERLRSGLRTIAEAAEDSERALNVFRERAYRRRTRRARATAAVVVAVLGAITFGSIAVTHKTKPQLPGYIGEIPENVPPCGKDVNIPYGFGGLRSETFYFGLGGNALIKKDCSVDGRVGLTIKGTDGHPLSIEGNGLVQILRGVVPPSGGAPGIAVQWEWSNWCGLEKKAIFEFVGSEDPTFTGTFGGDPDAEVTISNMPTCVDRTKPSLLKAVPWVPPLQTNVRTGGPLFPRTSP